MQIYDLHKFYRGWFIGDFEPSIYKTKDFEVALITHYQDENCPEHTHKIATEYNLLVKGKITVNGKLVQENQIFVVLPNESTKVEFLTDCKILCIKTPSVIGDKYEKSDIS